MLARWSLLAPLFSVLSTPCSAAESAWNGHTTPGSTTPSQFTPFYVPSGTTAYDSSDPDILYSGSWTELFSPDYYNTTARKTTSTGASATFHFSGTGVEWYGSKGKRYGKAELVIDDQAFPLSDCYDDRSLHQQLLFFKYGLSAGQHTIKVINSGSRAIEVDAFVVTDDSPDTAGTAPSTQPSPGSNPQVLAAELVSSPSSEWSLVQNGSTGVAAMQLAIISDTHAIIIDKVEHNPLTVDGHPAWGALFNLDTHALSPLHMQSNSFCAGGTFLSNGTLINVGGNPVVSDNTSSADFGDLDGLQAVRLFHPCDSSSVDGCDIYENHDRIRMASPRWYNTVLRLSDGSAMIIGGSKKGGWINNATVNNPTIEYYPPKNIQGLNGLPVPSPFLNDTLNSNLFPIAFALPDNRVFVAANRDAMIYDWQANSEQRLPQLPNNVRVTYPMAGTGLLLPLSSANNYTAEVLLCGGSTVDDTKPGYEISSQDPASAQCARIVLTDEGIAAGWAVEEMPQARIMPDAVLLPTGEIVIVNGGATGISGYSNVINQVGESNADNPVLTPVLYDPSAASGSRFSSQGMPASQIARLYHSVATLTPRGDIMIAGSNPNLDRSEVKYGTEYRVEWLSPPYMAQARPLVSGLPQMIGFKQRFNLQVALSGSPVSPMDLKVACMDLGFVTHAVHANSRLVYLANTVDGKAGMLTVSVTGPPDGSVYPPGPAWIYVVVDGVPSEGKMVMIGDGKGPEVDEAAIENILSKTIVDQYDVAKSGKDDDDGE